MTDSYLKTSTVKSLHEQPDQIREHLDAVSVYLDQLSGTPPPSTAGGDKQGLPGIKPQLDTPNGMSSDQLLLLLTSVMNKMHLLAAGSEELSLKEKNDQKNALHKKNMATIQKSREKSKKVNTLGIIATIFSWIAAIAAVAAAAVIAVVSLGTAGPLVATVAVLGLGIAIATTALSMTGTMDKITAPLAKALGNLFKSWGANSIMSKTFGKLAAQLVATLVILIIQVILIAVTLGASTGSAVSTICGKLLKFTAKAAKYAQKITGAIATAATAVSGGGMAAKGATNIAKGAYNKEIADFEATEVEFKALIDLLQTRIQNAQEFLNMLFHEISANTSAVNDMINLNSHSRETIISNKKNYA